MSLWAALYDYRQVEISTIFPLDQVRVRPYEAIREVLLILKHDNRCKEFRLVVHQDSDPLATYLHTVNSEKRAIWQEFHETADRLAADPSFVNKVKDALENYEWLTEIEKAKGNGSTSKLMSAVLVIDGVNVPVLKKIVNPLQTEMRQREAQVINNWEQHNPELFRWQSALQTVRESGIWMIDLDYLGYIPLSHVLEYANVYTHRGRLFMLRSLTSVSGWLSEMEKFCIPIDTFPKADAVWFRVRPDGIWDTRTIDYGLFGDSDLKKSADEFEEIWFGNQHNPSTKKWGAFWQIPSLLPVVFENSHLIPNDSVLMRLGIYKKLSDIWRNPEMWKHAVIHQVFREVLSNYELDDALHIPDLKPGSDTSGLYWASACLALNYTLTEAEKIEIVDKSKKLSSNLYYDPRYNWATRFAVLLTDSSSDYLSRVAQELRCSIHEAKILIDNIPYEARINMIEHLWVPD